MAKIRPPLTPAPITCIQPTRPSSILLTIYENLLPDIFYVASPCIHTHTSEVRSFYLLEFSKHDFWPNDQLPHRNDKNEIHIPDIGIVASITSVLPKIFILAQLVYIHVTVLLQCYPKISSWLNLYTYM